MKNEDIKWWFKSKHPLTLIEIVNCSRNNDYFGCYRYEMHKDKPNSIYHGFRDLKQKEIVDNYDPIEDKEIIELVEHEEPDGGGYIGRTISAETLRKVRDMLNESR